MNKRIRDGARRRRAVATLSFASAALAANTGSVVGLAHAADARQLGVDDDPRQRPADDRPDRRRQHLQRHRLHAQHEPGRRHADRHRRSDGLLARQRPDAAAERHRRHLRRPAAANKTGSAQCTGVPQSQAVWIMNLSVAGNTLAIPVYVNPTAGPEQALGGYKLSICLPPPDVPVGTPGRAFQGAQLLDAKLTLNNIFTTPTGAASSSGRRCSRRTTPAWARSNRRDVRGTRVRAAADHPRRAGQVQEEEGPHVRRVRQGHRGRRAGLGAHALRPPRPAAKKLAADRLGEDERDRRLLARRQARRRRRRLLPGERLRRRARLHRDGLRKPADAVRPRRLRHRDAVAVERQERRRQAEASSRSEPRGQAVH